MQEEDLDTQQGVIDFSLYLRSGSNNLGENTISETDSANITTVLDQKNYVEELNRHLSYILKSLEFSYLILFHLVLFC